MATAANIFFGPGGTTDPRGVTVTQRRDGLDSTPVAPGLPHPYGLGRFSLAPTRGFLGTKRARFHCSGAMRIATVGTIGDPTTLGAAIDVPVGVAVEVNLEGGVFLFGAPGAIEATGFLVEPAIGSEVFVVGEP